jgi:hypothetical protein
MKLITITPPMKLIALLLVTASLTAIAATEEQLDKKFTVHSGGKLIVDVDDGSIKVNSGATSEAGIDVWRKVTRKNKEEEEKFLRDNPVTFTQDGDTITVRCRNKSASGWHLWSGFRNRTEAKYIITLPAQFNARLNTAGGEISVSNLVGTVNANTSGGGLSFAHIRGPLDGETSGGGIRVEDCEGTIEIHTSGGGIDVASGSGSLKGDTSGGGITVKNFQGPARVSTSGGGLTIEDVIGTLEGSTSGGPIEVALPSPLAGDVFLDTSGGGVTARVAATAAFDLEEACSGGGVDCDLPLTIVGRKERDHVKGTVNGGGKLVRLRSSGGGVHVRIRERQTAQRQ